MSTLLQGVLKSNTEDLESKLRTVRPDRRQRAPYEDNNKEDSDDDLVNVVSTLSSTTFIVLSDLINRFDCRFPCPVHPHAQGPLLQADKGPNLEL